MVTAPSVSVKVAVASVPLTRHGRVLRDRAPTHSLLVPQSDDLITAEDAPLVFFQERAEFFGAIEQPQPLFVIERHREPPEAVYAHATFLADFELQGARLPLASLLFEFGDAREQFLFGGFRQCLLLVRASTLFSQSL